MTNVVLVRARCFSFHATELKYEYGVLPLKIWLKVTGSKCKVQEVNIPYAGCYGIFTYIWLKFMVNVGKYSIHGAYGYQFSGVHS